LLLSFTSKFHYMLNVNLNICCVICSIVSSALDHILQRIYPVLYAPWSTVSSASSRTSKRTHTVFYAQCSNVSSASEHTLQRTYSLTLATIFHTELLLDLSVFLIWNTVAMVTIATKCMSITPHLSETWQHSPRTDSGHMQYTLPTFTLKLLSKFQAFVFISWWTMTNRDTQTDAFFYYIGYCLYFHT
jgi:hypothetical protein